MFVFILLINLSFASSDFIRTNCNIAEYNKYQSFIEDIRNYSIKEPACVNKELEKEVKLTNLFNIFHKKLFESLYINKDPNMLSTASNICQTLSGSYKPKPFHYAFLIASAFSCHNICFNYFKIDDHYGIYYNSDNLSLFWSIASHTLEKGFACDIDEFIKITNLKTNKYKAIYFENPYDELIEEFKLEKNKKEPEIVLKTEENIIKFDVLIDNPNISLYSEKEEIIDESLRALINTYFIKDINNINSCFNNKKTATILLNFSIVNAKFKFDDKNLTILENYCLETLFNKHLVTYVKDIEYLKILGVFNLNLI